ncbi:MAG: hypothetical protein ACR2KP_01120 [Egibacteraceae bacterium]
MHEVIYGAALFVAAIALWPATRPRVAPLDAAAAADPQLVSAS